MNSIDEDEMSLGQDEVMNLEKLSRDQRRRSLNDSIFNQMLDLAGGPGAMEKVSESPYESDAGSESEERDNGLPKNPAAHDEEGSPEALTRKDTRLLHIVRAVSLGIILLFAVFVVTFTYRYTYYVEDETYQAEFTEVAQKIVESFLVATRAKLLMTKSVAEYISGLPHDPSELSQSQFERIVRPQQFAVQAREVSWSPILQTQGERMAFEQRHNTSAIVNLYPACYFCDDSSSALLNTDSIVLLPGFGNSLTCGALEQAGRDGEVSPDDCEYLKTAAMETCACGTKIEVEQKILPGTIFRIEDSTIVPETSKPVGSN